MQPLFSFLRLHRNKHTSANERHETYNHIPEVQFFKLILHRDNDKEGTSPLFYNWLE